MSSVAAETYSADELVHLEGLDAVRKRPGMYIGSTDSRGITHLVFEVVDNAVDEAIGGHAQLIRVMFEADGSVTVSDDGRGIPTGVNTKSGLSGVELVLTKLHAGGKFGGGSYATAGGLHGVGASVVNALSERLDVLVRRDGAGHWMSFHRGRAGRFGGNGPGAGFTAGGGLRTGQGSSGELRFEDTVGPTGTTIRWWPDRAVFSEDAAIEVERVLTRVRSTVHLVPGLRIVVVDNRSGAAVEHDFFAPEGLRGMVDMVAPDKPVSGTVFASGEGEFSEQVPVLDEHGQMSTQLVTRRVQVQVGLRWGNGYDTTVSSFVNVVSTGNGGTHVKGFERALLGSVRHGMESLRVLTVAERKNTDVALVDCLEGLTAVISVQVPEPQFVGQTKDELGTGPVTKIVARVVEDTLNGWLSAPRTKAEAKLVLGKIAEAARVRAAQRTAKEAARRKTALEGATMPAKLVDCRSTGVARSELFIVEGDSALGSAKQGRDGEYQALLPIRGKILNVQKASLSDMLKNAECAAIIQVLGAGSGRSFDVDAARYSRVLLMADADVDGAHIRCLLITLFYKYMRPLVERGRLYAAMPPLHKIDYAGGKRPPTYTYTAEQFAESLEQARTAGHTVKSVSRFKGLGEMDAEQLWETTMDPARRTVRRITIEDAQAAEAALETLMGNDVAPRRDWMLSEAARIDAALLDA